MQRFSASAIRQIARAKALRNRPKSVPPTGRPESYPPWSSVIYACPVVGTVKADGQPSDWALYVRHAVDVCGSVTELRRRSGVGRTSLYRYLKDDGTRVTLDVARRIALAISDKPDSAIRAAGSLLEQEEASDDPRLHGLDPSDPIVVHILSLDISDQRKEWMLNRRRKILEDRRRADLEEVQFLAEAEQSGGGHRAA